jgi:Na+/proline symporter
MRALGPSKRPTREQAVWTARLTIVVVVVVIAVLLLLYGISFLFGVEFMNLLSVVAVPITVGAAVPLLSWLQKRRELEFTERRAQTDALLQFLEQVT